MKYLITSLMCLFLCACASGGGDTAVSNGADKPANFIQYSDNLSSAGMPDAEFISSLAKGGVDLVLNVAPPDAHGALEREPGVVISTGMTYVNIPVDWEEPTQQDVDDVLKVLFENREQDVFLHCQMNMRASAFAFLHRVINLRMDAPNASEDLLSIWTPNETWAALINTALKRYQIDFQIPSND